MTNNQPSLDDQQRAEEFTELYVSCERRLYVYIVMLIGSPSDAHDLLQETSLILWQKFDQFQRGTHFLAWAREVARLRVLRYRRMHHDQMLSLRPDALAAISQHSDDLDDGPMELYGELLVECTQALDDADRELIQLRYASDLSVQSLAEMLNRTANAVSQSLSRIRRTLRKCVEKNAKQRETEEGSV